MRHLPLPLLPFLLLLLSSLPSLCSGQARLVPKEGSTEGMIFGGSVAISGDLVVVGAPGALAAYVFNCSLFFSSASSSCSQIARLVPSSPLASSFGQSVSISGNIVVVGDPNHGVANPEDSRGAVYVFRCTSSCTQAAFLTASNGVLYGMFGFSVSASGKWVAVSALGQSSVYMYLCETYCLQSSIIKGESSTFGTTMSLSNDGRRLTVGDNEDSITVTFNCASGSCTRTGARQEQHFSTFGWGNLVAIGNPGFFSKPSARGLLPARDVAFSEGKATIYNCNTSTWQPLATFHGEPGADFGRSLAIFEDVVAIGSTASNSGIGSVYLARCSGSSCSSPLILNSPDGSPDDMFGYAVALSERKKIVVSAPLKSVNGQKEAGVVYVF